MPSNIHQQYFSEIDYLEEFSQFLETVEFSDRNPLNTEMFFLWCMIRESRPDLFIESGTYKAYSANFICEALKKNDNAANFITIGYNLENCLPIAKQRLAQYSFAEVIEGDSRVIIKQFTNEKRQTAFLLMDQKGEIYHHFSSRL